jgi:acetyl-CoA acetyltransferase family protein
MAEWVAGKTGGGQSGGALKDVSAIELGAIAVKAALQRAGVPPSEVDHVVVGNAMQTSADALYGARHVGLKAGVPREVAALTVNRLCGSGLQSVVTAAQMLQLGEAGCVVAGGMENMSQAPFVLRGARGAGYRMGHQQLEDSLYAALLDTMCGCFMAQTSDHLAREQGVTRQQMDEYALRSHRAGWRSTQNGRFAEEIVPVEVKTGRKTVVVDKDDHLFPDTSLEKLAALPGAFGPDSMVTAGNASGIVDGAAAVVLTTAERARATGRRPLGTVRAWGYAGVEPRIMGVGPVPAIRHALQRAGLGLDQVDRFEINEAFAGQYLAVEKMLGLDREKVNVNGGAIALGHPLGATGTRLLYTLLLELRNSGKRYGVASACIGGGQGIAVVLERTPEA